MVRLWYMGDKKFFMNKPENPYERGSRIYKIMEGDFTNCTIGEIAEIVGCTNEYVRSSITKIRQRTGYVVPHIIGETAHYKSNNFAIDFQKWKPCFICGEKNCGSCRYGIRKDEETCKHCDNLSKYYPVNFCKECGRPLTKFAMDGFAANLKDYIKTDD